MEKIDILKECILNRQTIALYFIMIFTYYTYLKISGRKVEIKEIIINALVSTIISVIAIIVKNEIGLYYSVLLRVIYLMIMNKIGTKKETSYVLVLTIVSLGINYIIYSIGVLMAFIPNKIFKIENEYINLLIILSIYIIMVY